MTPTCLIAAHDPWFIQLVRAYAQECGFAVVQAHEGQDVLPVIQAYCPALILLRQDIPGQVKGHEVIDLLRSVPQFSQVPVLIFLSQQAPAPEDCGKPFTAWLPEPVSFDAFRRALLEVGVSTPLVTNVIDANMPHPNHRKRKHTR